jgi:membrane protein implicated in regulation of membrane protease activity
MDLAASTVWWLAAGLAVVAELSTGTFYLLMIALGLVAGAVAAHAGLGLAAQIAIAALVGGGATAAWHFARSRRPAPASARTDRNVNLDIGERVQVAAWDAERSASVRHRGTAWTAHLAPGSDPQSGEHVIVAVEGNWLVLAPAKTVH